MLGIGSGNMAQVTLRVIDGSDRGKIYAALPTPITIGREEGNAVQLNDERISRYHVKIQEDATRLVLTDLESTNGTRVNGEDVQMRILRFGDVIAVGRSVLLYGTREQIAGRIAGIDTNGLSTTASHRAKQLVEDLRKTDLDVEMQLSEDEELQSVLHMPSPPELPERLSPVQAAQLSELLEFFHMRVRRLLESARVQEDEKAEIPIQRWQGLVDMQARLAEYLRMVGEPRE